MKDDPYPMHNRYWCCGLTIGQQHHKECPFEKMRDGSFERDTRVKKIEQAQAKN